MRRDQTSILQKFITFSSLLCNSKVPLDFAPYFEFPIRTRIDEKRRDTLLISHFKSWYFLGYTPSPFPHSSFYFEPKIRRQFYVFFNTSLTYPTILHYATAKNTMM